MKSLFLIACLTCSALTTFAQKIEVKNDLVIADGIDYARIETDGCGTFDPECQYYISNLQGKRVFVVRLMTYKDPAEVSPANPTGTVPYILYVFSKSGLRTETTFNGGFGLRPKDVARNIVKARLLRGGELDDEAVQDFINANGLTYTERRRQINAPATIIIQR